MQKLVTETAARFRLGLRQTLELVVSHVAPS